MVDPLKVEKILRLPPPCTIHQIQGLQGKANFLQWFMVIHQIQGLQGKTNFLRWFMVNYANITKDFLRILNKDAPFIWDK
jgi:uncharacterized protein YpiB (UPF0302 family)